MDILNMKKRKQKICKHCIQTKKENPLQKGPIKIFFNFLRIKNSLVR